MAHKPKKAAKKKAQKAKPKPRKEVKVTRTPRQQRLPGTGDAKLSDLHNAALDYADIRDQRQALTASEVELKGKLKDLMHKYKKEEYVYAGVSVTLVHEQENVKVRVKKESDDEDLEQSEPIDESDMEEVEDEESGEELEAVEA